MPLYDKSAFLTVRADSEEEAERIFSELNGNAIGEHDVVVSTDDSPAEELDD